MVDEQRKCKKIMVALKRSWILRLHFVRKYITVKAGEMVLLYFFRSVFQIHGLTTPFCVRRTKWPLLEKRKEMFPATDFIPP